MVTGKYVDTYRASSSPIEVSLNLRGVLERMVVPTDTVKYKSALMVFSRSLNSITLWW